ncbi:coiled-coil domain-containing protein 160 [Rhynchocyon petersi]
MDLRRKPKKGNMCTPIGHASDCPTQASQPESSEQTALEKGRGMEESYNLSSQKFQEENKVMKKESISQLSEKEQEPKLRERKINISKSGTDSSSSAFRETSNLDVAAKESVSNTETRLACGLKELSTERQQAGDTRKKCIDGMSPKWRLSLLNAELEELNKTCKQIEEEFEKTEKELLNTKNSSTRSQNQQELGRNTSNRYCELQALQNDMSKNTANVKNLTKELQQAKEAIHKLNLENRDLKATIKKLKRQALLGTALLKDEMKLTYELELGKIRGELEAIKSELKIEKTLQARNIRALDLLRKHFDSVRPPSPSGQFPGNV